MNFTNDSDITKRLSAQRDDIYEYMCDRFKQLIAEDRYDDAMAVADEFYEWLDPEQMDDEPTVFFCESELLELYASMIADD